MEAQNCITGWTVVLFVIGTFLTTIILIAVSTYFFRRWRRNKGRHLVLVTRPEIVEDAYAFDNPCFKEAVTESNNKSMDRPQLVSFVESPVVNDSPKWSSPWSLLASGSSNKHDNRRTLDDSILLPTATRVCVVSLRSRDFTGLGFNVCGNMREGIFVKDLLHRGPASESGLIHPGDRIASVKISFRSMVYEDALTILSYASPYDVEIEVESGGTGSRPTTLLKKTVGPSPTRLCHPLYRSQSTPEFSRCHKTSAKRLIIPHPNESTIDSTSPKSIKSTPDSHTLKKRIAEAQPNDHKIGIKVLPSLDGVRRIVDQNEHNTNLERRNSKKNDTISMQSETEKFTQYRNNRERNNLQNSANETNNYEFKTLDINHAEVIVTDVPAEVHNAAIAARRNRKSSSEFLDISKTSAELQSFDDSKNSQKNKKKVAPAPPNTVIKQNPDNEDSIESIVDCTDESSNKYDEKIIEIKAKHDDDDDDDDDIVKCQQRSDERKDSESESDSEMQHSLTTIELNPADITIHHTPRPDADSDHVDDDIYRKAASLGDLSKYETKNTVTFMERAQSLDMGDNGLKKRKAPMPPDDIMEITEDLTKLDELENGRFDSRKLKKSDEWGTLEDALWETTNDTDTELPVMNKKNNGTLERSVSAVEMKIKNDNTLNNDNVINNEKSVDHNDSEIESFINLPSDKRLSKEFVRIETKFDPDENKILARIGNNAEAVKLDIDQDKTEQSVDDSDEELGHKSEKLYMKGLAFDKIKNRIHVESKSNNIQEVQEEPIDKITISSRLVEYKNNDDDDESCKRKLFEHSSDKSSSEACDPDLKVFEIVRKQNELEKNKENKIVECNSKANITIDERNTLPTNGDHQNVSNIRISSGENSEDNGLANGKFDDLKKNTKSPQAATHRSEKMDFITEIKVSSSEIKENEKVQQKPLRHELIVTSNDVRSSGKKPPVPPRRNDSIKSQTKDNSSDKQVVYVSQVKSPDKNQNEPSMESPNDEIIKKDFVNWIYTSDKKEQNPWGNDSNQSQSVTNIVVTSGDKTQL